MLIYRRAAPRRIVDGRARRDATHSSAAPINPGRLLGGKFIKIISVYEDKVKRGLFLMEAKLISSNAHIRCILSIIRSRRCVRATTACLYARNVTLINEIRCIVNGFENFPVRTYNSDGVASLRLLLRVRVYLLYWSRCVYVYKKYTILKYEYVYTIRRYV